MVDEFEEVLDVAPLELFELDDEESPNEAELRRELLPDMESRVVPEVVIEPLADAMTPFRTDADPSLDELLTLFELNWPLFRE